MAMLPNAVGCVKSEIHNVVSAMRLSRWASNARFKMEIPLQVRLPTVAICTTARPHLLCRH